MEPQYLSSTVINPALVPISCKSCSLPVGSADYFCPHCGKKLAEKPVSLSMGALIWLLVVCITFPLLGIGMTIKYIKSKNETAKIIGWISLVITIVAFVATMFLAKTLTDSLTKQINTQLQNYR